MDAGTQARLGLKPIVRRVWSPKGTRPLAHARPAQRLVMAVRGGASSIGARLLAGAAVLECRDDAMFS